jgi:hypothetical protein
VRVYDLYTGAIATELSGQPDAVGGVSFSPATPLLALCTGQRHFKQVGDWPVFFFLLILKLILYVSAALVAVVQGRGSSGVSNTSGVSHCR